MDRSVAERRRAGVALAALTLAAAGVAAAGLLLTEGSPGPDSSGPDSSVADSSGTGSSGTGSSATSGATAPATGASSTRPAISPPPADPDDVATDTAEPARAAVQITYAGADEAAGGMAVGAYVAGLVERGGYCVLTLSRDGASATAQSESVADASTTSCGQLLVPFSEVTAGTWTADVTYTSPAGHSVAGGRTTVEVP